MNRPNIALCLLVLLAGTTLTACGSGGGNVPGGGGGGTLAAAFTPTNSTPGANSITMAAGSATGDTFQVVVNVTDITDFFGAAFRIAFDSASAEFLSFDASNSFLNNHPASAIVTIDAEVDPTDAGTVLVVATLQNSVTYTQGFTPPATDQELLTLTFRATNPSGGNAFTFDSAATREVTTCPPHGGGPTPACVTVPDGSLTWDGGTMTAN